MSPYRSIVPRLRVGVIGTGWVARARHLPSFLRLPEVSVEAVCDRRIDRAREVAAAFRIPAAFDDPAEMLAVGLDVVSIATPPWCHADLALEALSAGCHVFCEKPMAMNEKEARGMVDAAADARRLLCISHNFLFSRTVQRADQALRGDDPSYVAGMQFSSLARRLPEWYEQLPGGLLLDESPHMLYVLSHFCGAPLKLDHTRARRHPGERWPSTVELLVEGPKAAGQITMCFESPVSEWHVAVVSPRRALDLDLFRDILTSVGPDRAHKAIDIARTSVTAVGDQVMGSLVSGVKIARKQQFWGHDSLIAAFVDACATRGVSPVNPADSLSIVALTDRILDDLDLTAH